MTTMPVWAEVLCAFLLIVGGAFTLIGAIGMLRLRDFFMRLHAPTKATTLGVGGVLLASMAASLWHDDISVRELLVTLFLFLTAPVSAALMAKAALHLELPSQAELPPDLPRQ